MKQKDLALIILIAGIAAIASFFLSHIIFESGGKHSQKAAVVDAISTDFQQPDSRYFNSNAIDPTQLIQIGGNSNNNPFNGKSQ
jgi:hypothetical protein